MQVITDDIGTDIEMSSQSPDQIYVLGL